jgi:hypothetical protein
MRQAGVTACPLETAGAIGALNKSLQAQRICITNLAIPGHLHRVFALIGTVGDLVSVAFSSLEEDLFAWRFELWNC